MKFASLHDNIKNTPINGTILKKHQLNTSGRPQTPKRKRKILTWPVRMKKKKRKKRGNRRRPALLVGNWRWGEVPTLRKAHSWWGSQLGQKGTFRGSEENEAIRLWKAGQSKSCIHGLRHCPVCQILSNVSPGQKGAGFWKVGFGMWRESLRDRSKKIHNWESFQNKPGAL